MSDTLDLSLFTNSWNSIKNRQVYKENLIGLNMMLRIFMNNPDIKPLWKFAAHLNTEDELRNCEQLKKHGASVFKAVDLLINRLNSDSGAAEKLLVDLGKRHIKYGAKVEHIPIIGKALVDTIKETLGDDFTHDVANAWNHALGLIAVNVSKGLEQSV